MENKRSMLLTRYIYYTLERERVSRLCRDVHMSDIM